MYESVSAVSRFVKFSVLKLQQVNSRETRAIKRRLSGLLAASNYEYWFSCGFLFIDKLKAASNSCTHSKLIIFRLYELLISCLVVLQPFDVIVVELFD